MRLHKPVFAVRGIVAAIGIISMLSGCAGTDSIGNSGQKTVRIAANLPLSGDIAFCGQNVKEGSILALEGLKKTDPTGPDIKVDWQDNAGQPSTTVSIMQKQFIEPPDIYVSGVHPQTMAIKERIEAKGTPHFVWIFDQFLNKNNPSQVWKNNFRTWVNLKIEPPLFLAYAKAQKSKRVAIVYVRLSHEEEVYERAVVPGLKALGIENIFVEPYELGAKEQKMVALKVRSFKPDLIILSLFQKDLVGMVRALRSLSLITDRNTICAYDMLDAEKILGRDEIEGIRTTAPVFVTRAHYPEIKRWTEQFRTRWHREPFYTSAYAYDAIMIIHDVAKRLKLPASSQQWIKALRSTKLNGVTGPLSFDDDGSLVTPVEVGVYHNGKLYPDSSLTKTNQ